MISATQDETRGAFKYYQVDLDDAIYSYNFIKDVITDFHGDGEKFYPTFYKAVSEELLAFKNLSRRCSVLLGFEVANLVLAHLSRTTTTKENEVAFQPAEFTLNERNIINYSNGYVFATLYRRIRKPKQCNTFSNVQSMSILLAGKCGEDNNSLPDDNLLVDANNRGGLWKVNSEPFEIFLSVELLFRSVSEASDRLIDSKAMVSQLVQDCGILSNFTKIRNQSREKVSKEISLNLLEHLIMLYIRVRAFSFVKDKREKFKLETKKKKINSLRTTIKKSCQSMEQGH